MKANRLAVLIIFTGASLAIAARIDGRHLSEMDLLIEHSEQFTIAAGLMLGGLWFLWRHGR